LNYFTPLRDFVSDERVKVSRRATERYPADIGGAFFYLGISERGVDLTIEPVDSP
jgi:hypothetical protein